jgi:DnaJ like chaperone protein
MGFFSRLAFGGLGFALGGPLGALVGYVLSSVFDNISTDNRDTDEALRLADRSGADTESATPLFRFQMSLLALMAAVMKADGVVKVSELDVVKQFLPRVFPDHDDRVRALQILKGMLQQEIDVEGIARQVSMQMDIHQRLELLYLLLSIAFADNELDPTEDDMLRHIAHSLGISMLDYESQRATFFSNGYGQQSGSYGQTDDGQESTIRNNDWAYTVLEIQPTATNEEVKKAYRTMAMKYHPDRVNTLGEDMVKLANEKFEKVNKAYSVIKQERGL